MNRRRTGRTQSGPAGARDRGTSLIEILVAIVLLGTIVIATLGALRVSVVGTRTERDHARAHQWLQSATGVLNAAPRVSCEDVGGVPGEQIMREAYQDVLRDQVDSPTGWQDWQITVVEPVEVWDGTQYWSPYDSGAPSSCFEPLYQLQMITIQVESPDQRIIETRQVVRGG